MGCRSVDLVVEEDALGIETRLPLETESFQLFDSEGVLVYARSEQFARDIAIRVEAAENLLTEKTGEQPSEMVYFAVDLNYEKRSEFHARAFEVAGSVWDLRDNAFKFSRSKGVPDEQEMSLKLEEALAAFEKGVAASRSCGQWLEQTRKRVQVLTTDEDGELRLNFLDGDEDQDSE